MQYVALIAFLMQTQMYTVPNVILLHQTYYTLHYCTAPMLLLHKMQHYASLNYFTLYFTVSITLILWDNNNYTYLTVMCNKVLHFSPLNYSLLCTLHILYNQTTLH